MKKLIVCAMAFLMSLTFNPLPLMAAVKPLKADLPVCPPVEPSRASAMMARIQEIKSTDLSKLTKTEQRQLRKEMRNTRKQVKELGGGVYISIGALLLVILIVILLVILL